MPESSSKAWDWNAIAGFDVGKAFRRWLRGAPFLLFAIAVSIFFCRAIDSHWKGLNGNSQWTWHYEAGVYLPDLLAKSVGALLPAIAGFGALWLLVRRLPSPRLRRMAGLVLILGWGIYVQAASWWTIQIMGPSLLGSTMLAGGPTGFTEIAIAMEKGTFPAPAVLFPNYSDYLDWMPMHPRTHPPGNVLLSDGVLRFMNRHPAIEQAAHRFFEAFDFNFGWEFFTHYSSAEQTTGAVVGTFVVLAGLLAAWPLFGLALRCSGDETTAWFAAAIWMQYPAFYCMTPSYDQMYVLFAIGSLWAFRRGFDARPALWGALTGLIGAAGLLMTFKILLWLPLFLPLLLLDAARQTGTFQPQALWRGLRADSGYARNRIILGSAAFASFAASLLLLWLISGINLVQIFIAATRMQADLTGNLGRTYWLWFFYGPYDVLLLAGPALAALALAVWFAAVRSGWRAPASIDPCLMIFPVGLVLVTISGTVLGENARQLLMFGPGLAWAAAVWIRRPGAYASGASLVALLIAQHFFAAICINSMFFIGRS